MSDSDTDPPSNPVSSDLRSRLTGCVVDVLHCGAQMEGWMSAGCWVDERGPLSDVSRRRPALTRAASCLVKQRSDEARLLARANAR
jgi:hypothetical protein